MKYLKLIGLLSYGSPTLTAGVVLRLNEILRVRDADAPALLAVLDSGSPVFVDFGGTAYTYDKDTEAAKTAKPPALTTIETLRTQALVSKDGTTGVWRNLPASGVLMRVRMTGTGTVSMDSATGDLGAGTVTTAAYAASVAGTQIDDYAYPGDAARSIRFTLTGTAAVEVY